MSLELDTDQELSWMDLFRQGHGLVLFIMCLAVWQHAASSMLAATTLPRAVSEIGGEHLMGWAYSLYQLGSILAGALAAAFVRKYDIRNSLMVAALLYGLGCLLAAMAPQIETFLMGRFIQGFGGGWMLALVFIAINRFFPDRFVTKIIALLSVVWSVSAFCGPLVGGAFANLGLWRYAYGAFTIQSMLFIIAVYYVIPQPPRETMATMSKVSFSRMALLAVVILVISFAGANVHPVYSPLMIITGLGLLYGCFQLDRLDLTARMFPLNTLKPRHTVGAGFFMIFFLGMSTMSFLVYGPALLEIIFGVSPLGAGYIVALESVAWGGAALAFSNTRRTMEPILFRTGSALIVLGTLGLALSLSGNLPGNLSGHAAMSPLWPIIISAILHGVGFGMMWGFIMRRILDHTSQEERDRTSTAFPVIHQIGMAIGAAISNVVANGAGYSASLSIPQAQEVAFWIFMAFIPLLLMANMVAWRFARQPG